MEDDPNINKKEGDDINASISKKHISTSESNLNVRTNEELLSLILKSESN